MTTGGRVEIYIVKRLLLSKNIYLYRPGCKQFLIISSFFGELNSLLIARSCCDW